MVGGYTSTHGFMGSKRELNIKWENESKREVGIMCFVRVKQQKKEGLNELN